MANDDNKVFTFVVEMSIKDFDAFKTAMDIWAALEEKNVGTRQFQINISEGMLSAGSLPTPTYRGNCNK
jgi:hypothetical protein